MAEDIKTWIDEMIEREVIPEPLREETTTAFCERNGIPRSTYYYELNKKDNWDKIEELCFKQAKKHTPEILDNLGRRAKNDTKSAEVFMEFILERKKRMDITSNDKPIVQLVSSIAEKNGISNNSTEHNSK